MTRKERALKNLKQMCSDGRYLGSGSYAPLEVLEDFEVAIKALEQEPILDKINKMKSEIASSLEFWDYSPNNNPLARDMLETLTHFWGDIREVEE